MADNRISTNKYFKSFDHRKQSGGFFMFNTFSKHIRDRSQDRALMFIYG